MKSPEDSRESGPETKEALDKAKMMKGGMRGGELKIIDDLTAFYSKRGYLTEKQVHLLHDIISRTSKSI